MFVIDGKRHSVGQVAGMVGISKNYLLAILRGARTPSRPVALSIERITKIPSHEFLAGEGKEAQ